MRASFSNMNHRRCHKNYATTTANLNQVRISFRGGGGMGASWFGLQRKRHGGSFLAGLRPDRGPAATRRPGGRVLARARVAQMACQSF